MQYFQQGKQARRNFSGTIRNYTENKKGLFPASMPAAIRGRKQKTFPPEIIRKLYGIFSAWHHGQQASGKTCSTVKSKKRDFSPLSWTAKTGPTGKQKIFPRLQYIRTGKRSFTRPRLQRIQKQKGPRNKFFPLVFSADL